MTIFTGKTTADAIATGVAALNTTREHVTVNVVTEPRSGFLGLGRRAAAVDVALVVTPTPAPVTPPTKTPVVTPVSDGAKVAAVPDSPAKTGQVAQQAHRQQAIDGVAAYVATIIEQLGFDATLTVERPGHRQVRLALKTTKEGLLIGKHGRTINALQDLAQLYLNHHGAAHVVVELDVANYRQRRATTLDRLADNTAREVVASGKPIYLDPMPSFERKQIHAKLAQNRYVTTYSAGKEPHRAVVIEPV